MCLLYPLANYSVTEGNWVEQVNMLVATHLCDDFPGAYKWFYLFHSRIFVLSEADKSIISRIPFPYKLLFPYSFLLHLFYTLSPIHAVTDLKMET